MNNEISNENKPSLVTLINPNVVTAIAVSLTMCGAIILFMSSSQATVIVNKAEHKIQEDFKEVRKDVNGLTVELTAVKGEIRLLNSQFKITNDKINTAIDLLEKLIAKD